MQAKRDGAMHATIAHPLSAELFEESQKLLCDVLDHPSMPKSRSIPDYITGTGPDDEFELDYDEIENEDDGDSSCYRPSYVVCPSQ